jgi:hypothetical protein
METKGRVDSVTYNSIREVLSQNIIINIVWIIIYWKITGNLPWINFESEINWIHSSPFKYARFRVGLCNCSGTNWTQLLSTSTCVIIIISHGDWRDEIDPDWLFRILEKLSDLIWREIWLKDTVEFGLSLRVQYSSSYGVRSTLYYLRLNIYIFGLVGGPLTWPDPWNSPWCSWASKGAVLSQWDNHWLKLCLWSWSSECVFHVDSQSSCSRIQKIS